MTNNPELGYILLIEFLSNVVLLLSVAKNNVLKIYLNLQHVLRSNITGKLQSKTCIVSPKKQKYYYFSLRVFSYGNYNIIISRLVHMYYFYCKVSTCSQIICKQDAILRNLVSSTKILKNCSCDLFMGSFKLAV